MEGTHRIIAMYRRFLTLAARMTPAAERARVTAQVRAAFRSSALERDPAIIDALVEKARGQLSYLRMAAPRRHGDTGIGETSGSTFTVRDGAVVGSADLLNDGRIDGKVGHSSYASGATLDSNALRRHAASLERFRFGGRERGR
jgi:hypothetical protein